MTEKKRIDLIPRGGTRPEYVPYTIDASSGGGIWINIKGDNGDVSILLSERFIKDEILTRLTISSH